MENEIIEHNGKRYRVTGEKWDSDGMGVLELMPDLPKPESSADVVSAILDLLQIYMANNRSYSPEHYDSILPTRAMLEERFAAAQKHEAEAPVYVLIQTVYANKEYMGLAGVFRRREDAEKAQGDCWDIVEEVKIK